MNQLSDVEIIVLYKEAKEQCKENGLYLYLNTNVQKFVIEKLPLPFGGWIATCTDLTEVFEYLESLDNQE